MEVQEEVKANYEAFQRELPSIVKGHPGKFALMQNKQIVEYFDTARDAYVAGKKIFQENQPFSIQEVIITPLDLGFFSHAMHQR
jgi:hypothetical protein